MTESTDTGTRYYANRGKVYADDHTEAGTARSANGAELERHDRALQEARAQREELDRRDQLAEGMRVELVQPARSHWLELERGYSPGEPFSKEELHPVARVHFVPRVGTVLADMSADRYVASTPDGPRRMGEWRIYLKRVRVDAESTPELWTSPEVSGVGPKTRPAIGAAVEEAVRSWLESADYKRSRQRAAAAAIARQIKDAAGSGSYAFDRVRQELAAAEPHLARAQTSTLKTTLERIAAALEKLEELGKDT